MFRDTTLTDAEAARYGALQWLGNEGNVEPFDLEGRAFAWRLARVADEAADAQHYGPCEAPRHTADCVAYSESHASGGCICDPEAHDYTEME